MGVCVYVCVCVCVILQIILDFPCGSAGREFTCNARDLGSIPRLGKSPGEGKGYTLQYYGLENRKDYIVYGVTKSRTWLSDSLSPIILHTHTHTHTYLYNGILFNHKKKILQFATTGMNLEDVMLSKSVRQRKHCMLSLIIWNKKKSNSQQDRV